MKRIFLLGILMVSLTGCKKKLTQFYIDYTADVVIQSTVGQLVPFSVYTPEIVTNSEFEFESNNTKKDKIESIHLRDLNLTIKSPSGETFSFLNSLEVFISSPQHTEQKVAFKESIPSNVGTTLICDVVDTDIQHFIKDDRFTIRLRTVTDETIPQDVTVEVYSNFFVDAKLVK